MWEVARGGEQSAYLTDQGGPARLMARIAMQVEAIVQRHFAGTVLKTSHFDEPVCICARWRNELLSNLPVGPARYEDRLHDEPSMSGRPA